MFQSMNTFMGPERKFHLGEHTGKPTYVCVILPQTAFRKTLPNSRPFEDFPWRLQSMKSFGPTDFLWIF